MISNKNMPNLWTEIKPYIFKGVIFVVRKLRHASLRRVWCKICPDMHINAGCCFSFYYLRVGEARK